MRRKLQERLGEGGGGMAVIKVVWDTEIEVKKTARIRWMVR